MNDESIGFLQVIVKTASGALPVENALVTVYEYLPEAEESVSRGNVIYSLTTNEDGKTPKVALGTKNKELSMSPGNINPYSVYNIGVEKEGFYSNRYINVPIFSGVTALQPVELIPLVEYANSSDNFPESSERTVETPNTDL